MTEATPEMLPASRPPLTIGHGGQLILWAMRCWLDGRRCWHLVQTEFLAAFGLARGLDALEALESALCLLDAHARRALRLCPDGTAKISPDERLLLQTVEAARASNQTLLDLGVATLVPRAHQPRLSRDLTGLGDLLARGNLDCDVRVGLQT